MLSLPFVVSLPVLDILAGNRRKHKLNKRHKTSRLFLQRVEKYEREAEDNISFLG